jgi:YbbR domain-containing protein
VKTRIFKNLGWKIVGLVLSFALWFHLTTKQQFNQKVLVEIEYKNIPAGLRLMPESLKTVSVDITANGRTLFEILYFSNLKLTMDLHNISKPGKYSVELSRDQLSIPSNLDDVRTSFIGLRNCEFELAGIQTPNANSGD